MKNTYVFLGDSITDANRLFDPRPEKLGYGYVSEIASELTGSVQVINRGHNGFTAYQVEKYLESDCLCFRPYVVTLMVGINDLSAYLGGAGGYGPEEFQAYLGRIVSMIQLSGSEHVVLMEPFLFPEPAEYVSWMKDLEKFQQAVDDTAWQYDCTLVPTGQIFREMTSLEPVNNLTTDGIHLTPLGHRILSKAWFRFGAGKALTK